MTCEAYHVPVMLAATVDGLNVRQGGVYVDVTFGGGGHSREILRRLGGTGHLYSFDQDADAMQGAEEACLSADKGVDNFTFVHSNFRFLKNWMRYYNVERIDGVLADLGVSSHHFDDEARGFSFRYDARLDMRMNQRGGLTAADIVNTYDESRLTALMRLYGEVRDMRRVVRGIVTSRAEKPIMTTGDLVHAIYPTVCLSADKVARHSGEGGDLDLGYLGRREGEAKKELARVFQALRIEVNGEMRALEQMLLAAQELLGEGGRLSVLTYHSLEDRMVKNIMRSGNTRGEVQQDVYGNLLSPLRPLGKAQTPTADEQRTNPRSRSARLRVAEKRGQE